ncbi:MAG: Smr/MutS family protein [Pseudomonadota bacterium]
MTRRRFTDADRELWSRVTRDATPLHPKRRSQDESAPAKPTPPRPPAALVAPFQIGSAWRSETAIRDVAPSLSDEMRAAPLRMDAKTNRKMMAGKLRPEGKLDLHGMTLDVAHPALTRFILGAHAQGKRLVLVVTGKGKVKPSDGPIPARLGVLRHQVPQWLRMAPLASVVLQVSEAHRAHGGGGAFYVYLRRLR